MKRLNDDDMGINEDKCGTIRLSFYETCNYTLIPYIRFKYLPTIDGNIAGNIIVHGNENCIYVCIPLKYYILKMLNLNDNSIDKNKIKFEYYNKETYLDECDVIKIKDKMKDFKDTQPKINIIHVKNEEDVIMVGGTRVIKEPAQNSDCVYVYIPDKYMINNKRKFNEI